MTSGKAITYTIPVGFILRISVSLLLGQKRSFRDDALELTVHFNPPIQVSGVQNIPTDGKTIITVNHYSRPGLNAWWLAFAISSLVEQDIHWLMTAAWMMDDKWYGGVLRSLSHRLFARLAKIYHFTTMPPMPAQPRDAAEQAEAVRRILSLAHGIDLPVIGFSPEGRDFTGSRLGWPPYGAGRFVYHINKMGYRILPAGVYEEDGQMRVQFGLPYDLGEPHSHAAGDVDPVTFRLLTRRQIDLLLTRTVMRHIAILLPERLRGEFA